MDGTILRTGRAKPFFCISGDKLGNMTAKRFLDAVSANAKDEAMALLSKRVTALSAVDFDGLKRIMGRGVSFKYVCVARRRGLPKNMAASSVMIMGGQCGGRVLNLYMVSEPDAHGDLKIVSIQEDN
jgi:hypothetical protein